MKESTHPLEVTNCGTCFENGQVHLRLNTPRNPGESVWGFVLSPQIAADLVNKIEKSLKLSDNAE